MRVQGKGIHLKCLAAPADEPAPPPLGSHATLRRCTAVKLCMHGRIRMRTALGRPPKYTTMRPCLSVRGANGPQRNDTRVGDM